MLILSKEQKNDNETRVYTLPRLDRSLPYFRSISRSLPWLYGASTDREGLSEVKIWRSSLRTQDTRLICVLLYWAKMAWIIRLNLGFKSSVRCVVLSMPELQNLCSSRVDFTPILITANRPLKTSLNGWLVDFTTVLTVRRSSFGLGLAASWCPFPHLEAFHFGSF